LTVGAFEAEVIKHELELFSAPNIELKDLCTNVEYNVEYS